MAVFRVGLARFAGRIERIVQSSEKEPRNKDVVIQEGHVTVSD